MIRPLEYCTTLSHIQTSISTIDSRISELKALRQQYVNKEIELEQRENNDYSQQQYIKKEQQA